MRIRRLLPASFVVVILGLACAAGSAVPDGPATVRSTPPSVAVPGAQASPQQTVAMPNASGSLKFAVLGDFGTGSKEQYQMAATMAKVYERFKYELVVMVGDNLYGSERPQDFKLKFEVPYKPLLDAGVKFYASLGNHDAREQKDYKLFNMDGKLYYSMKAPKQSVRFFALESTYMDPDEVKWIEDELKKSGDDWKIPFFHHPPYSSGERHGSEGRIRETLEPLFIKYNVSVVLTGHDHFYERIKPQNGIVYFVVGAGGQLRKGNLDRGSPLTAKGMDTDQSFMIAEIDKDQMWFNAISRTGQVFDSGVITRRK